MGPENKVDLDNCTLYLNGEPIAWGQGELPEITVSEDAPEPENALSLQHVSVEFTMHIKTPKRCRCRGRKRFVKLMISEGLSRNKAEWLADFVRGLMSYQKAWENYLLRKTWKG